MKVVWQVPQRWTSLLLISMMRILFFKILHIISGTLIIYCLYSKTILLLITRVFHDKISNLSGISIACTSGLLKRFSSAASKYSFDRCHSLSHSLIHSPHLRCLWIDLDVLFTVCHLEFDKEAISDGCRNEIAQYRWGSLNFKWF